MGEHTVVGVDIAKAVLEVAVSKQPGSVSARRRLSCGAFLVFLAQVPQETVLMEACGSAHYWGRRIQELGHQVVLLPPHQVRPYVTRNKTDRTDAKGILEAYRNADIHPVPVKSIAQQVLVCLHRFRSSWVSSRTAQVNTPGGEAESNGGLRGRCQRLAPLARIPSWPGADTAPHEAEDTFAVPTFLPSCATPAPVPTPPQGFNERRVDERASLPS